MRGIEYLRDMRYRVIGVAVATLWAAAPATAQSAGQWGRAEKIYGKVCSYCHETLVGPRLFGRSLPSEYVQAIVLQGRGPMPAFRPTDFSEEELKALGTLIQTRSAPWSTAPGQDPGRAHEPAGDQR